MATIGLTGGSGSGKSTVASLFRDEGYEIVDADAVARRVVLPGEPALAEIVARFGSDALQADGSLDRKKLGRLVFSDRDALDALNRITHRYITAEIRRAVEPDGLFVIDAPLLIETGLTSLCDAVVSVLADRDVRLARIMARDGLSREDAWNRLQSQPDDAFYRDRSDRVFENNTEADLARIRDAVRSLCDAFRADANAHVADSR